MNAMFFLFYYLNLITANNIQRSKKDYNLDAFNCSYYREDLGSNTLKLEYIQIDNITINTYHSNARVLPILELRDSDLLLIAASNLSIFVYDRINKLFLQEIQTNSKWLTAMIQLKSGLIATSSSDSSIRFWDPKNNFTNVKTLFHSNKKVNTILELRDSGYLLSGSDDNYIKIWDLNDDFKNILNLTNHDSGVYHLSEMTNGYILSAGRDTNIFIWDLGIRKDENGKYYIPDLTDKNYEYAIKQLSGHYLAVTKVIHHSNTRLIISGSHDFSIKVWDPFYYYENIFTIKDHVAPIKDIKELKNGCILTSSEDGTMIIYNPNNNFEKVYQFKKKSFVDPFWLELRDGNIAIADKFDIVTFFYEVPNFFPIIKHNIPKGFYSLLTESNDEKFIAISSDDFMYVLDYYDLQNTLFRAKCESGFIISLFTLKKGYIFIAYVGRTIKILERKKNRFELILNTYLANKETWSTCAAELNDDHIAIGFWDGSIYIGKYHFQSFDVIYKLKIHSEPVNVILQLRNGFMASGSTDNTVKIVNYKKSQEAYLTLDGLKGPVESLLELPNEDLVVGCRTGEILIFKKTLISNSNQEVNFDRDPSTSENAKNRFFKFFSQKEICLNLEFKYVLNLEINAHVSAVDRMILLKNKYLVTSSREENIIYFWDITNNFNKIYYITEKSKVSALLLLKNQSFAFTTQDGFIKIYSDELDRKCVKKMYFDRNSLYSFIKIQNLPLVMKRIDKEDENNPTLKVNKLIPEFYIALGIKNEFTDIFVFKVGSEKIPMTIKVSEKPISTYHIKYYEDQVYIIFGFIDGSIKISVFTQLNFIKERYFLSQVHDLAITDIISYRLSNFISCSDEGRISIWNLLEPYQEVFTLTTEKNRKIFKCHLIESLKNKNNLITLGYGHFSTWRIDKNKINLIKTYYENIPESPIYEIAEDVNGYIIILTEERLLVYNTKFEIVNTIEKKDHNFKVVICLKKFKIDVSKSSDSIEFRPIYTAVGMGDGSILIFENIDISNQPKKKIHLNRNSVIELFESQMGFLFSRYSDWSVKVIHLRSFD